MDAPEVLSWLLENGAKADLNSKSEAGWPVLCSAALLGHCEVTKVLIEHRADVNATIEVCKCSHQVPAKPVLYQDGSTPLKLAGQNPPNWNVIVEARQNTILEGKRKIKEMLEAAGGRLELESKDTV